MADGKHLPNNSRVAMADGKHLPNNPRVAMADDKHLPNSSKATMAKKHLKSLAELISTVTNPAIVFILSLAFITNRFASTAQEFLSWTAIGAILLVIGPGLVYAIFTWRKDQHIDLDITEREDRVIPLMLASLGALFGGYLISTRLENDNLFLMSNILVAMLVALTVLTFQWKVSLHTATFSALVTLLLIFITPYFALLYLGLFAISCARLYLKKHTMAQVVGGSLVGVAITMAIALIFRY